MRRALIITVIVVAMLAVAAVATGKTPFVKQPTPEAVTYEHIDALNACDVDRLMAQYPESIHIVLPGGVTVEGRDDVRDLFEGFCLPYPDGLRGLTFTEVDSWKVHKTINMQWSADACFLAEPYLGADAYETWSGLMAAQVTTFDGAELVENPNWEEDCAMADRRFYTTAGPLTEDQAEDILSHQHMFVEFGAAPPVEFESAKAQKVYKVIGPLVDDVLELGYDVFIEPTPLGVGRRPDIVEYIADKSGMATMMATGIYHEPYIPDWVYDATVNELADWMVEELTVGVGDTDVPAGFIKLADNWDGIRDVEMKILEAACDASTETGASIASHILSSWTALDVIDSLEGFGCDADRFIWIHAPYTAFSEGDDGVAALMEAADRGAFLSHDFIGSIFWADWVGDNGNARHIALIEELVDAGYEDHILIGSDTGWYDPGFPEGFVVEPYDQIATSFVPDAKAAGFSDELLHKLLHDNPWSAYSR